MVLLHKGCEFITSNNDNSMMVDLAPSIVALGAVAFSIYQLYINYRQNRKEKRRNEIYKKLNGFYGPFSHLRKKSYLLYQKFQKEYREADPNFRTLQYLLDGHEFPEDKKIILKEIIKIGKECEDLIYNQSGLIDDDMIDNNTSFKDLLSRASTHYLVLKLAFAKGLIGNSESFKDLTFPRTLDDALKNKEKALKDELNKLNSSWF